MKNSTEKFKTVLIQLLNAAITSVTFRSIKSLKECKKITHLIELTHVISVSAFSLHVQSSRYSPPP